MTKKGVEASDAAFKLVKADFDKRKKAVAKNAGAAGENLTNMFKFCEEAFGAGSQELLILVTELTVSNYCAHFIGKYGCEEYFRHNKDMLFFERKKDILQEIESLNNDFDDEGSDEDE